MKKKRFSIIILTFVAVSIVILLGFSSDASSIPGNCNWGACVWNDFDNGLCFICQGGSSYSKCQTPSCDECYLLGECNQAMN